MNDEIGREDLRWSDPEAPRVSIKDIGESFDFGKPAVVAGFDSHVREQLPWYELVTSAVAQIARHYIPTGGRVYDIGASNGNVGRALADVLLERDADLIAIESSRAMVQAYNAPGKVLLDSAEFYDFEPFDLAVAMLSLMFVSPAELPSLLSRLRSLIRPGGALIVVERMLPPNGYASIITSRLTLAAKLGQGAPADEVLAKELSLAGIQRPLARELLGEATEWFRFGDFAGWLIEPATNTERETA